jgi:hypothetical protein
MGRVRKVFLFIVVLITAILVGYFLIRRVRSEVLGVGTTYTPTLNSTFVPSSVPLPVATPTSTPIFTPIPTKIPTPIPTPAPVSSEQINALIDKFSAQYGVDPNLMRRIAICESGFRSNAVNGPYKGLYQFGAITWKNIRKEIGEDPDPNLRLSAEASIKTAAYAVSQGKRDIWPHCNP